MDDFAKTIKYIASQTEVIRLVDEYIDKINHQIYSMETIIEDSVKSIRYAVLAGKNTVLNNTLIDKLYLGWVQSYEILKQHFITEIERKSILDAVESAFSNKKPGDGVTDKEKGLLIGLSKICTVTNCSFLILLSQIQSLQTT